jgi:hypothetical protein
MRRYEYTTSFAENGLPSWNVTPVRRWKVQVSWSSLMSQDLASARAHLEVFVRLDERVEDVLEYLERKVRAGLLRVKLVGLARCRRNEGSRCGVPQVHPLTGGTAAEDEHDDHSEHERVSSH